MCREKEVQWECAGQLEQSLVDTLRQHAAPEEAEELPAALAPAAQPPAAINTPGHAEEVRARAVEELHRVTQTLEGRRYELEQSQAALDAERQRGLNILRQMNERTSIGDGEVLFCDNSTHREAMQAADEQHARLMSSAARDTSEGLSALARTQASLEQLTRDAAASGEGELAEQTAALGGTWETQRRGMRPAEDSREVTPVSCIHCRLRFCLRKRVLLGLVHDNLQLLVRQVGSCTPAGSWP